MKRSADRSGWKMNVPKIVLCNSAYKNKSEGTCYGYGTSTMLKVIPWDMCKDCPKYVGNKGKKNEKA